MILGGRRFWVAATYLGRVCIDNGAEQGGVQRHCRLLLGVVGARRLVEKEAKVRFAVAAHLPEAGVGFVFVVGVVLEYKPAFAAEHVVLKDEVGNGVHGAKAVGWPCKYVVVLGFVVLNELEYIGAYDIDAIGDIEGFCGLGHKLDAAVEFIDIGDVFAAARDELVGVVARATK